MNASIKLQVHVRAHMPRGVRRGAHRKEEGHESCVNNSLTMAEGEPASNERIERMRNGRERDEGPARSRII